MCGPDTVPEPECDRGGGDHPGQQCAVRERCGRSENQRVYGNTGMAGGSALSFQRHPDVATVSEGAMRCDRRRTVGRGEPYMLI